jgi:hypothetical protein
LWLTVSEPLAAILEFHLLLTIKVHFTLQETKKNQHTTGSKSPERLALNSRFHIPLSGTPRVPSFGLRSCRKPAQWMGEACYCGIDITRMEGVKTFVFQVRIELNG